MLAIGQFSLVYAQVRLQIVVLKEIWTEAYAAETFFYFKL